MPSSISVQLYSVNDALNADLDGGLSKLANMGLRYVEAFDFVRRPAELRAAFDRHGLTAPTGHAFLVSEEVHRADGTVTQVPPHEETFRQRSCLASRPSLIRSSPLRGGPQSRTLERRQGG
jgi:hypothetical protein